MIAKELSNISDKSLISSVQHVLTDHLVDEARHSKFFSEAFIYVWKTSSKDQKLLICKILPAVIWAFSHVDEKWMRSLLSDAKIKKKQSHEIVKILSEKNSRKRRILSSATATFNTIKKAGVLGDSLYYREFLKADLHDI